MSGSLATVSPMAHTQSDEERQNPSKEIVLDTEKTSLSEELKTTETRQIHGLKWVLVCSALYLTAFLYGLDTTIAADVQGPVIETFGDVSKLSWLGSGFPLGSVAVILLLGSLFGRFDQKWLYIVSLAMFEIGSILCGAAPSMDAMIGGRVIAGIGGAGIYLGALNYFSALTSPAERGTYISGIGLVWGLGTILGPVIGGAFSSNASTTWRWAFYINAPLGAVFTPIFFIYLPSLNLGSGSFVSRFLGIDWLGFLLSSSMWAS